MMLGLDDPQAGLLVLQSLDQRAELAACMQELILIISVILQAGIAPLQPESSLPHAGLLACGSFRRESFMAELHSKVH